MASSQDPNVSAFWVEAGSRVRTRVLGFSVVLRNVPPRSRSATKHASATYERSNGRRFGPERGKRGEGKKDSKKKNIIYFR